MAIPIPKSGGFESMLKEGASYYTGVEEAVIRSIDACNEFTRTLRTSFGPRGLNKIIINHLEKLFVTNDAATIIRELGIEHPAAKLLVMASQMQEKEVGDGTNFVILLAGALLEQAEELIRAGIKPAEIIEGYELARDSIVEKYLEKLVVGEVKDLNNFDEVFPVIRTAVMSKQYGQEDLLAKVITNACISIHKIKDVFNVDNIRVCKILGAGVSKIDLVQGMVFKRQIEGTVTKVKDAKVVVFTCPVDISSTETKGTVLIHSANELKSFSQGEESLLESQIKEIADLGVNCIVSGGKFGDLAVHYCNKYNIMMIRLTSKFDVRRVCKTVGAIALPKLSKPQPTELGLCDNVYIDEIGDTPVVIFKQNANESKIATIVVRGSTDNIMDDIERAIDDGVNTYKTLLNDPKLLAGAGAAETTLAQYLTSEAETLPGLEQYSVAKFADALKSIPSTIAENAGIKSNDMVTLLIAEHQQGKTTSGVNIDEDQPSTINAVEKKIFDLHLSKLWGIKYATNAVCTVLQVGLIICAKKAGGPVPKNNPNWDED